LINLRKFYENFTSEKIINGNPGLVNLGEGGHGASGYKVPMESFSANGVLELKDWCWSTFNWRYGDLPFEECEIMGFA
jgi:hypothetical protein